MHSGALTIVLLSGEREDMTVTSVLPEMLPARPGRKSALQPPWGSLEQGSLGCLVTKLCLEDTPSLE